MREGALACLLSELYELSGISLSNDVRHKKVTDEFIDPATIMVILNPLLCHPE
jgi:hypothetical protein